MFSCSCIIAVERFRTYKLHLMQNKYLSYQASFLTALICAITIISCSFKRSHIPASSKLTENGLTPERVFIQINEDTVNRNEFYYGEKVYFEFSNLDGFQWLDELIYPGMSLLIKQGDDTLFHRADIFPELDKGTDLQGIDLVAYVRMIFSYRQNENFLLSIRLWDKKGTADCHFEMPFKIKTNEKLQINENGLGFKSIYLWDKANDQSLNSNKNTGSDELLIFYEEVSGFNAHNDTIFPAYSILITDSLGHVGISDKNIFADFAPIGIPLKDLDQLFPLSFKIDGGLSSGTLNFTGRLYDLNLKTPLR